VRILAAPGLLVLGVRRAVGRASADAKRRGGEVTHGEIITALAQVREDQGLSLRQLGAKAGAAASCVMNWERGERSPTLPRFIAWAAALGYSVTIQPSVEEEKTNG
jgi:ribosome-binding protein aMBF1 (putative translation factor)